MSWRQERKAFFSLMGISSGVSSHSQPDYEACTAMELSPGTSHLAAASAKALHVA